jgi:S-(hydroxymethyl)glutathione dehydrogenase/alcohol dehydrogenase
VTQVFRAANKGGTVVMVGMPPLRAPLTIDSLGLFVGKTLKGAFYGASRYRIDMPALVDAYMVGKLKLDELISRSYPLEAINDAFDALKKGEVARSIIKF